MSVEETVFAVEHPRYLVEEYLRLITDVGFAKEHLYRRCEVDGLRPDVPLDEEGEDPIAQVHALGRHPSYARGEPPSGIACRCCSVPPFSVC